MPEGTEQERETGWGNRIERWKGMDKKFLARLSDEPLEHERGLGDKDRGKAIMERQIDTLAEVSDYVISCEGIEVGEYFPGPDVIRETIWYFGQKDKKEIFLRRKPERVSEEEFEKLIDATIKELETEGMNFSRKRRFGAMARKAKEEGDRTTQIFCTVASLAAAKGVFEGWSRDELDRKLKKQPS